MQTLFDIARDKIRVNGRVVATVVTNFFDGIKAGLKIRSLEKKKQKYYMEIGRKYFKKNADSDDATFEEDMSSIQKTQEEIVNLRKKIPHRKPSSPVVKTICPNCNAELKKHISYCPYCGTKLDSGSTHNSTKESIVEDGEKKKTPVDIILPQEEGVFFDPSKENDDEEGLDETVKIRGFAEDHFCT